MAYQSVTWTYGVALSGLTFPLQTASGTFVANNYGSGGLSGSLSVNGGPWGALGYTRVNVSQPGNGMYSITSLSAVEMSCYTWAIMITAVSGCIAQGIVGTNLSGPARATDVSSLAGILTNTSYVGLSVSGLNNIAAVDYSGIAGQTWNTLTATYTSAPTFAGMHMQAASGILASLVAISAVPLAVASGFAPVLTATSAIPLAVASGFAPVLTAVSNPATSSIAGQVWNTVLATATSTTTFGNLQNGGGSVNISSIANQVWNTLLTTATSTTTFGNLQNAGGSVNVSSIASQVWNTVQTTATSTTTFGGMVNVSGLGNILTAVSNIPLAVASGFLPIMTAVSNTPLAVGSGWVGCSGINSLQTSVSNLASYDASGFNAVLTAVSGLTNNVSGLPGLLAAVSGVPLAIGSGWVGCSGINSVMVAVSGVPAGVAMISIQDGDNLTSGTLAHTARLLRWFSWDNLVIDKTYTPNRLYLRTDAVNISSWWSLTDGVNSTNRARGG